MKVLLVCINDYQVWRKQAVCPFRLGIVYRPGLLERLNAPIPFIRAGAGGSQSMTYGYEATLFIDLCNAILSTSEFGIVDESLIAHANIIIRSVAKVGIIALVDEATGYDKAKSAFFENNN